MTRLALWASLALLAACSTSGGSGGSGGGGSGGPPIDLVGELLGYSLTLQPGVFDCADSDVHCVDDDAGAQQEFDDIQDAVDFAGPGDVVLVHDGDYAGFRVDNSGTDGSEILITANGNDVDITVPGASNNGDGIYVSNADYVIIEGFNVSGANENGIGTHDASATSPMRGVQIRYNTVSASTRVNIYLSNATESLILGNTTRDSVNSHGIYVSNAGADDVAVIGNRSYGNNRAGIHFNGDLSVGGDGLQSGQLVAGNIVYHNASNGINCDGVQDSAFANNLVYENGNHGIRVYEEDASDGAANLQFVNNTIVDNPGMAIKLTADSGGHLFFNNILVDNNDGCVSVERSNIVSDHNIFPAGCFFEPANPALFFGAASQTASPAQLFNDPAADDYTLIPGSPAQDGGVSELNGSEAPPVDLRGGDRHGSVDIGAFEL